MHQRRWIIGQGRTDEFRKDAVCIALTSGLARRQLADDLGVGMSTLNKWITAHRDTDVVSKEDLSLAQENERLRRENRILKEENHVWCSDITYIPARRGFLYLVAIMDWATRKQMKQAA